MESGVGKTIELSGEDGEREDEPERAGLSDFRGEDALLRRRRLPKGNEPAS